MSQSSPTPDPVAWVETFANYIARHVMSASDLYGDDDPDRLSRNALRDWTLAHPVSALPATTPSDGRLRNALCVLLDHLELGQADVLAADVAWVSELVASFAVSPSEGSAPDTPTLADQIAREMMWKGHGCGLYADDGEMRCQCPVDWKRDSLPALHEHFRAKQLARALAPVPPSAPDTKPDDPAPTISNAQDYAMHWAFLNAVRGWPDRWAWQPEYVSRMFEHVIGAYLRASSPPEGEDTQRIEWLEQKGGYVSRYNSDFEQWKGVHWETHNMGMNGEFYGGTAREAIDSARAAIPPQNTGHE